MTYQSYYYIIVVAVYELYYYRSVTSLRPLRLQEGDPHPQCLLHGRTSQDILCHNLSHNQDHFQLFLQAIKVALGDVGASG